MKTILIILTMCITGLSQASEKVLVFSKTKEYRHESIEAGVKAIVKLGKENNFEVTHTEDSKMFSLENLKSYNLVVFLSTSGNVLNRKQQKAFKNYINNGGNFVGVHSATATEYNWEWYNELIGAYFLDHPEMSHATINISEKTHPSTQHLPKVWNRYDEWYNFESVKDDINIVLTLDESSYKGGKHGDFHPIAWCKEFNNSRMFYTGLGHTEASYKEPEFTQHLLGGILYCLKKY
ncbi:ThuA domain-containing protein [Flaviramulus sp. BrNp1-15]|uniref:ThuA domain-containing protein n=1 Tax=Flaviramulus sp. BrNp1-15 TaxID=2916754 RepID=UPI001EE94894|nr:ThuA domain-containing protein [Flaviramulus sp. BrNp1-15]ULC59823.1 ThuA domain-containing protein [Flaviramulus sp. BrNp1-15]